MSVGSDCETDAMVVQQLLEWLIEVEAIAA